MTDYDQQTCGQGLAAHAPLPALMGELTDAVAEILELHLQSIDPEDPGSRAEFNAYVRIAREHREAAMVLRTLGDEMELQEDLPMAEHDMEVLTQPRHAEAFERFVKLERDLRALLDRRLANDETMLAAMRS